jgi:hypothetical protein
VYERTRKAGKADTAPRAAPPLNQSCATCAYYFSELGKTRCRAVPPYALMGGGGQVLGRVWPEVGPGDWCGNWTDVV